MRANPFSGGRSHRSVRSGTQVARGEAVQELHPRLAQAPRVRLVRRRRVGEPVAQDRLPGFEGREDDPADVLGPRRFVEQQLGLGEDGFLAGGQQERADLVGERRAARFPGDEVGDALSFEVRRKPAHLGCFPGSFDSLEGDEDAPAVHSGLRGGVSTPTSRTTGI